MIKIRKYQIRDYDQIREICMKTAKKKFRENEVVCWMFLDYFLESECEHVFVVLEGEKVVGYIVSSTNPIQYEKQMKEKWIPKIKKQSLLLSLFTRICLKANRRFNRHCCEFHMNIAPKYQHRGLGKRLLDVMNEHLILYEKNALYCITENRKTTGYKFYKRYGFRVVKRYFIGVLVLQYDLKKNKAYPKR